MRVQRRDHSGRSGVLFRCCGRAARSSWRMASTSASTSTRFTERRAHRSPSAAGNAAVIVPTSDRSYNLDNVVVNYSSWITLDGLRSYGAGRAGVRVTVSPHVTIRNGVWGNNTRWGIFTGYSDDLLIERNECFGSRTEHGIYVSNAGDRPIVRDNWVHDNRAAGIQFNSATNDGSDGMISDALVENNRVAFNGSGGGAGLAMYAVESTTVRNNVLWGNHAAGIVFWKADGALAARGCKVLHNTVDMPSDAKWALHFQDTSGMNLVRNNLLISRHFWRGGIRYGSLADVNNVDSDYNTLDRVSTDDGSSMMSLSTWRAQGHEAHSFSANVDALWSNPSTGDYHLKSNSPAIDRGQNGVAVAVDFDGAARPAGGAPDLGAYEAGGSVTPPPAPTPVLTGLSLSASEVVGGASLTGTVSLSAVAPSAGMTVALGSGSAAVVLSSSIFVPSGAAAATFSLSTRVVTADIAVPITATLGSAGRTVNLMVRPTQTVTPPPPSGLTLTLGLNQGTVRGGTTVKGTLTLSAVAPAGGLAVAFSSSHAAVSVPVTVVVLAGQRRANLSFVTAKVTSKTAVTLTATAGTAAVSRVLTLK